MFDFFHIFIAILVILVSLFGPTIVRFVIGSIRHYSLRRAQARIAGREGEYIEGRYQPFGIPVGGFITRPYHHIPRTPDTPQFPLNEVWITTVPRPYDNEDRLLFHGPQHCVQVSYLYYPQNFNRFYFHIFHQINRHLSQIQLPAVEVQV